MPPPVRTDVGTILLDATPTVAAASVPLRPANADDSAARSSTLLARNGYGLGDPSTPTEPATSSADLSVNATAAAQAAQIQRLFVALDAQAARMRNETERATAAIAAVAEAASKLSPK